MLEKLLVWFVKICPKAIQNLFYRYESIWRYCYYGAWTTLISYVTKLLGQFAFGLFDLTMSQTVPNLVNTAFSWVIAASFAFVVNKKYVFHSTISDRAGLLREMGSFYGARLASLFLEMFLLWLTTSHYSLNYPLMAILVQFIILAMNYIFSKLVVFKKGSEKEKQ